MNIIHESENHYVINLGNGQAYLQRKGPITASDPVLQTIEEALLMLIKKVIQQELIGCLKNSENKGQVTDGAKRAMKLMTSETWPVSADYSACIFTAGDVRELLKQQRQNCAESIDGCMREIGIEQRILQANEPELKP